MVAIYEGEPLNATALRTMFEQIIATLRQFLVHNDR